MNCNRSLGMSNSDRSRWKHTEQTMIEVRINLVQHTQCSNITSMTQRKESLIRAKPGHRIHLALEKLKMTFSSRLPTPENNAKGLGEQMHGSNETTQRCPQRNAAPTSKYQFIERHGRQYHARGLRRWAFCQTSRQECRGWDQRKWKPKKQDQVTVERV